MTTPDGARLVGHELAPGNRSSSRTLSTSTSTRRPVPRQITLVAS